MIKSIDLKNDIPISRFWATGSGTKKSVKESHAKISNNPFLNIILTGRKGVGKTTVALNLIKHFMTNKTKLFIFSPDIMLDTDNRKAIEYFVEHFGEGSVVIYKSFKGKEDENNLLNSIDEAADRAQEAKEKSKSKYVYPSSIFYFDDLSNDDFKSEELGHFSQNIRHYNSLCIYSSQDWINFEPRIRKNVDIVCLFGGITKERKKFIYGEIQPNVDVNEFYKIYHFATNEPKNFLFIDVMNKKFRKNLTEDIYIKDV